jgi:hypothetical protein
LEEGFFAPVFHIKMEQSREGLVLSREGWVLSREGWVLAREG